MTVDTKIIEQHINLLSDSDRDTLLSPLKHLGIDVLYYNRLFPYSASRCTFSTNPNWTANSLQTNIRYLTPQGASIFDKHFRQIAIFRKICPPEKLQQTQDALGLKEAIVIFNLDKRFQYCENFTFGTTKCQPEFIERLLTVHNAFLHQYVDHLLEHKKKLFDTLAAHKIVVDYDMSRLMNEYSRITVLDDTNFPKMLKHFDLSRSVIQNLSEREIECYQQLAKGFSYKGIAQELSISPRTVESHIQQLKEKLNCPTRDTLVKYWHENISL